jgi:prophage DNA circulation protein
MAVTTAPQREIVGAGSAARASRSIHRTLEELTAEYVTRLVALRREVEALQNYTTGNIRITPNAPVVGHLADAAVSIAAAQRAAERSSADVANSLIPAAREFDRIAS